MSRRGLIAGNWKMNCTVAEATALTAELRRLLAPIRHVDFMVAPPYTALWPVAQRLEGSHVILAGQELYPEAQGAFTGAVNGDMLAEVGCGAVLVGHSERRQLFGETLDSSRLRLRAALAAGLTPVLCVGETLDERRAQRTMEVVGQQVEAAIDGVDGSELAKIVIAYEPVWAIGTGEVATPGQAQEVHGAIRERIRSRGSELAEGMRILYGGSVKPDNAAALMGQADIDGALVGGASLKAESFAAIARAYPSK